MADYFVVDAHAHTYKTREIAQQAMAGAGQAGCEGTPEDLLSILQQAGIAKAVQVNMTPMREMFEAAMQKVPEGEREAVRPQIIQKMSDRVHRRNQWTCEMAREHKELIAFPSVDPLMPTDVMIEEVEACKKLGAKGIKLHPAEGHYYPRDDRLWPVYKKIQKLGLPVISHGGMFMMYGGIHYTRPANFEPVLESFPNLKLVIAHLGHGFWEEAVELAKKYKNVYFDTSAVLSSAENLQPLTDEQGVDLIRRLGVDRVMFGSDYPWFHPGLDLNRFLRLPLKSSEKEKVLGGNAQRILGIS